MVSHPINGNYGPDTLPACFSLTYTLIQTAGDSSFLYFFELMLCNVKSQKTSRHADVHADLHALHLITNCQYNGGLMRVSVCGASEHACTSDASGLFDDSELK